MSTSWSSGTHMVMRVFSRDSMARAKPKSHSLMFQLSSTSRFSDLMSRWIMLRACIKASADATSCAILSRSGQSISKSSFCSSGYSSPPGTNSITISRLFSGSLEMPINSVTLGWRTCLSSEISRFIQLRSRSSLSSAMDLTATSRPAYLAL